MSEPIIIFDYDPYWPKLFEELQTSAAKVLGNLIAVEHVGSTSVPGLPTKLKAYTNAKDECTQMITNQAMHDTELVLGNSSNHIS